MRNDFYPEGTVHSLLQTDLITEQTKKVLQERFVQPVITEPSFFTREEFTTLQAVCKRLLPQPEDRLDKIDLAGILDTNFKEGTTDNGWRYSTMPPDDVAYKLGLRGIEQSSLHHYNKAFGELSDAEQDDILSHVQQGTAAGEIWQKLPSDLFFKELLAFLNEIYYSHPIGKNEIGDASMADAKGWYYTKLNQLDKQEPKAVDDK